MTAWFVRRAKAAWWVGVGLAIAGLIPVILFAIRALVPGADALLALPPAWVAKMEAWLPLHMITFIPHPQHAEIVFTLVGLAVMWLGATIAGRQKLAFEMEKRLVEDRMRRVQQYSDGARLEPYIGPAMHVAPDSEPR